MANISKIRLSNVDYPLKDAQVRENLASNYYTKTELNNLITTPNQQYVTVASYQDLPATGAADTTYRVSNWDGTQYNDSVFSEYAWNGSAYIKLSTKSQIGEVYDISANHADTKYADLAAALGTNGANIPDALRKGGMSVKYVQSSDNKYVQYRYMEIDATTAATFTNVANWQGVDSEPTPNSDNLVKSGGVLGSIADIEECTETQTYVTKQINKEDGSLVTAGSNRSIVVEFAINDSTKYIASGTQPTNIDYCSIAYYGENNNYLGYEKAGNGITTEGYSDYILTIPQGAKFIKIYRNTTSNLASLKRIVYKDDKLSERIDELSENVLVKQEQVLTDEEINNVLTNLKLTSKVEVTEKDIAYAKAILLEDGALTDSVPNARVYTFGIPDLTYDYYATGRKTSNTSYCSVAYYDENQTYLGYEIQGGSSENFNDYKLTVPQNAKYIKIWGNTSYNLTKLVSLIKVNAGLNEKVDVLGEMVNEIEEKVVDLDTFSINNKTIAIIGSSVHTGGNDGEHPNAVEIEIMPEDVGVELSAYLTYEDVQGGLTIAGVTYTSSQIGTEITFTPTAADIGKKVGVPKNYNPSTMKVWWKYLIEKFGCTIIPVCWSGAGFTRNRQGNAQYIPSYAWHDSQIRKCGIRIPGTMNRTAPDIIILARGTNDMSYEPYARLTDGYFDNPNWQYPTDDSVGEGIYGFKEGIMTTISKLRSTYPFAKILICTTTPFKRVNYSHFPMNNGLYSQPQYNNAYREVAEFCGIDVIDFAKCGITWENMYPTYISDSETTPTHPNAKGHEVMAKCAIEMLKNINFDL